MNPLYYYREFDHLLYFVQYARRQHYLASSWQERQLWDNALWFLKREVLSTIDCQRCN